MRDWINLVEARYLSYGHRVDGTCKLWFINPLGKLEIKDVIDSLEDFENYKQGDLLGHDRYDIGYASGRIDIAQQAITLVPHKLKDLSKTQQSRMVKTFAKLYPDFAILYFGSTNYGKDLRYIAEGDLSEGKNSFIVYRGEYSGNRGGPFWTPDREFARQFTQSGPDHEIKERYVDPYDIFTDVKPYGGDPDAIDAAIAQAKAEDDGFKALWCSEGAGEPDSLFVYDRSILTMRP